ncbi:MAG: peptidoglycan-binding domain-containing protein [Deltaproteobacteria bacterium]
MHKKKKAELVLWILLVMFFAFPFSSQAALSSRPVLKQGMRGTYVNKLQYDLKAIGFFKSRPTSYFGPVTKSAVFQFQTKYNLKKDGIVGSNTYYMLDKLLGRLSSGLISRNSLINRNLLVPWFENAEKIFYIGAKAKVIDVGTKLSFNIKRSYGYNHADVETLTAADTSIMKKIYGGQWSWERRSVIVVVNGKAMAASMAGMPHAGREDLPADSWVSDWRTGDYGPGYNLEKVKGNNMSGHFDIHFLGSKTHGTDKVDDAHQSMVYKAAQSGF